MGESPDGSGSLESGNNSRVTLSLLSPVPRRRPARECRAAALVTAFLVAGCAVSPVTNDGSVFRVDGRLGVRHDAGAFNATFVWTQWRDRYEIEFWGPLGSARTRLAGDAVSLTIDDASGRRLVSGDAEALMRAELGWYVPMEVLAWWIRGTPSPDFAWGEGQRDEGGRLSAFAQLSWRVRIDRWTETAMGPAPARIRAERGGDRITVVCKTWRFGSQPAPPLSASAASRGSHHAAV